MTNDQPGTGTATAAPAQIERTRTAVVVVHGMGEQMPLDTMYRCVRTALPKVAGRRIYYSRPERLTDSFEARRCLAPEIRGKEDLVHGQVEFFEYHWSYLMTGNRLGDLFPTTRRLVLRPVWKVPAGMRGAWCLAWLLLVAIALGAWAIVRKGTVDDWSLAGVVSALLGEGVVAVVVLRALKTVGGGVTKSFVDVVRYLDRSPRSYAVRRDIRQGMVDLLTALHDKGRYSRVILVAHSLGAYIAYDGIAYLWPQLCKLHAGGVEGEEVEPLAGLSDLESAAEAVHTAPPDGSEAALDRYRAAQFTLWQNLRRQGNPWLVTDFVTLGTPMYFADLLFAHDREQFADLVRTGVLPVCPPRAGSQTVESADRGTGRYGWPNHGRTVLHHAAPFAVVRWTNLFYPVRFWLFGDWFGGPLRPLFGNGIRDRAVLGNKFGRFLPAVAHGRYFSYPDDSDAAGIARVLQDVLALDLDDELEPSRRAPGPAPETDITL